MPLYVFGSNYFGQLGLGDELMEAEVPVELEVFKNKKVVKMCCGKLHTLILCENNELFTWGVNDDYALGREGIEEIPLQVDFPHNIVDIAAGASFSAILTDKGHVYGCGTFKSTGGIIGFDPLTKFSQKFIQIPSLRKIKKISAGQNHLLLIDSGDNLWTVGANESLQLGRQLRLRKPLYCLIPMIISKKKRTENHVFVGASAGAFHSFGINQNKEAFGWGSNFNGQLGNGTYEPSDIKTKTEMLGIESISCGLNHSLLLTVDKILYGCGDNSQNQLGLKSVKMINVPAKILTNVLKVRAGSDFSIAQVGNKLLGFGLNSRCCLGIENLEEVVTPTEIPFNFGKIIDFGCGNDFTIVYTQK